MTPETPSDIYWLGTFYSSKMGEDQTHFFRIGCPNKLTCAAKFLLQRCLTIGQVHQAVKGETSVDFCDFESLLSALVHMDKEVRSPCP